MNDDGTDEIIEEFLVESAENLDRLDRDLVGLERDPTSRELLESIFRAMHTLKGTTGFLGFGRLEQLAHVAENLLSKLRDGVLALDARRATALLETIDAIRGLLDLIETTGDDKGGPDLTGLMARLTALQSPAPGAEARRPPAGLPGGTADPPGGDAFPIIVAAERSIRVDVELLDSLMRQVGELVLTRNQVVSLAGNGSDPALTQTVQRLSQIVSGLQEGVVKTRMQPVETLWAKVPRLVRDLSSQFGKLVNVTLEGGETELDRSVLEAVKDPLTHLVRNAADHGIESPEVRRAAGKPAAGTLTLRAYHEGGQVRLEITDDGAGVDPAAVAASAVERGLVTPGELGHMTRQDVIDLIFRPGFSTAKAVTNVSGRGVGMDVVRTNIERIGGTVDLQSVPGTGTTVRVRIPLTLAIIPAVLVGSGPARYAIPQAAVHELVRLEAEAARTDIEHIDGAMVFRLRRRLLPLVCLAKTLAQDGPPLEGRAAVNIAVVGTDGQAFGLVVDRVYETQEIVVKPLCAGLERLSVYGGATILGDGRVALILDVPGLADAAGVAEARHPATAAAPEEGPGGAGSESLLLVRVGADRRVAIPLARVVRLEAIDAGRFARAGNGWVIPYRDDLLPVVSLTDLLGVTAGRTDGRPDADSDARGTRHVVVCGDGQRSLGLLADAILDVVDEAITVSEVGRVAGLCGTAVIRGRVADVLDVAEALGRAGARPVDPTGRSGRSGCPEGVRARVA